MNSTEIVLEFLVFLSHMRSMFRQVHLFAEQSPLLRNVSTSVIPFKGNASDYADHGVTISVSLNADLYRPTDTERKAIGMSLLLRHTGGVWLAEAEVGWSGGRVGWDPFGSREARAASLDELASAVPPLIEWMGSGFREEVANLLG